MPKSAHSAVETACVAMYHGVPTRATTWTNPKSNASPADLPAAERQESRRRTEQLTGGTPPPEEKNGLTHDQAPECPGLIRKWFGSSIRKHVLRPLDESSVTSVRANENHNNTVSIGNPSKRAYPLQVGHLMASTNERHGLMALLRLWQIRDFR